MTVLTDLFSLREKEVFEALRKLEGSNLGFVLIGGYAVNAYTLSRFSIDCDVVVKSINEAKSVDNVLASLSYVITEKGKSFVRCEKEIEKGLKVAVDVLVGEVLDRQTGAVFSAEWVFQHSSVKPLRGKTILEEVKVRIVDVDALVAMKLVSGRAADIRDVFMLLPLVKDLKWLKEEISAKVNFKLKATKLAESIASPQFRNNLQGVYGFIDNKTFEKHRKALVAVAEI